MSSSVFLLRQVVEKALVSGDRSCGEISEVASGLVLCLLNAYIRCVWLHNSVSAMCSSVLREKRYWSDSSQPLVSLLWLQLNRSQLSIEAARIWGSDNDTDVKIRLINPQTTQEAQGRVFVVTDVSSSYAVSPPRRFGPCRRWTQGGQRGLCDPQEAWWDQSAAGKMDSSAVVSMCRFKERLV